VRTLLLYYDEYHTPLDLLRQKLSQAGDVTILRILLDHPGAETETNPRVDSNWPSIVVEARQRFCDEIIVRAIKANACYQSGYYLSAALSRPLMAIICSEQIQAMSADRVVHGLAGNDQFRFEMGVATLSPQTEIVSVAALLGSQATRNDHGFTESSNLWGSSIEAGPLADPWQCPGADVFKKLSIETDSVATAETHIIRFEQGVPVALDAVEMKLPMIITTLHDLGKKFGVGCSDLVEDGYVGLKTRAIYESAAALAGLKAARPSSYQW